MWMNEGEVEDAADLFTRMGERQGEPMPNCVKGAEILQRLVKWTNRNSDGWPYWNAPAKAATKLMDLLHEKGLEYRRSSDVVEDITDTELMKALVPIKSFLTKRGVDHADILEPPKMTTVFQLRIDCSNDSFTGGVTEEVARLLRVAATRVEHIEGPADSPRPLLNGNDDTVGTWRFVEVEA